MDISVIIPAYNARLFILDSVWSVLNSTGVNVEVIVVDDGSEDNTIGVLSGIERRNLTIIKTQNHGVASARNTGLEAARGKYIGFLDADDLYETGNLEAKFHYLESHTNVGVVYSSILLFDDNTGNEISIIKGQTDVKLRDFLEFNKNVIQCPSSVLIRKEALEAVGGFDTTLSTAADLDMWIRLSKHCSIGYIDKPLVRYRVHQSQMHYNFSLMERDNLKIFKKYKWPEYFQDKSHYNFCRSKFLLILSFNYGGHTKKYHKAIQVFLGSLYISPLPFFNYLKAKISRECAE